MSDIQPTSFPPNLLQQEIYDLFAVNTATKLDALKVLVFVTARLILEMTNNLEEAKHYINHSIPNGIATAYNILWLANQAPVSDQKPN
jgi:hypothetical protein